MMKPLKELAKDALFGPLIPQSAWEALHRFAMRGMNIGGGSHITNSGELWALDRILPFMRQQGTPVVFDVGANVGHYAKQLHAHFDERVMMHCFEPSARPFATLDETVRGLNGIETHPFGFGDSAGTFTLYTDPSNSALASVYPRNLEEFGMKLSQQEQIELRTVDEFCEARAITRIDLLKLDCEGHELKVLKGAAKMLQGDGVGFIQFEFGGCNLDSRTYFRDFFELLTPRYNLFRILRRGLAPIAKYHEVQETFTTTNFLAAHSRHSISG